MKMNRNGFLVLAIALVAAAPGAKTSIVTYRDEGCSCCEGWVAAARAAGFDVALHDLARPDRLKRFRISESSAGCHTSLVAGYLVEGHVPLDIVARLLRERPRVRGIGVPGMPTGVAGMGGSRSGPLDIMTLEDRPRLYARVS
jgi:hypothetical protein